MIGLPTSDYSVSGILKGEMFYFTVGAMLRQRGQYEQSMHDGMTEFTKSGGVKWDRGAHVSTPRIVLL